MNDNDMDQYGLRFWSDENFFVSDSKLAVKHKSNPSLLEIVDRIREDGHKGPLLLRFPHIIKKQIDTLFRSFNSAKEEFGYKGEFHAVFPLKVNQFPNFVSALSMVGKEYNYGLEAGSKAELLIAMSKVPIGAPISVNGFKDKEMISLAFIAAQSGHDITVTIEGLDELKSIIEVNREFNPQNHMYKMPKIGMRIRLHSGGIGVWAKSGGYGSKFGLNSTELLEAHDLMLKNGIVEKFHMIHFHIGSQMSDISPLKKALREAGHIYADLKKLGFSSLSAINIGGGLAVEYAQHAEALERNYSIEEFANDVLFLMQEISKQKGVAEPDIFTESGRFVAASHAVLVAPVLELFSQEYSQKALRRKAKNPPLIEELYDLHKNIEQKNAREYLHDALDHAESLHTLFDLGYIDIEDRSNAEILASLIVKKAIFLLKDDKNDELKRLKERIQERYLVNFSMFQSLPDFWGLAQRFPIAPLDRLDEYATNPATIWDITCDSDGEISFDSKNPLHLHNISIDDKEYFLAFFLVGAYQEVLGMKHNLFTHPTEVVVEFDEEGNYILKDTVLAMDLLDLLAELGYDKLDIKQSIKSNIEHSSILQKSEKAQMLDRLDFYLGANSYLKTIQAIEEER